MKLVNSCGKIAGSQAGQVLPMALVLLAAAIFIVIPVLYSAQIGLKVNNDSRKDTRGYYAAEAGVADALWRFKSGTAPFTPSSSVGSSYSVGSINGLDVKVSLLKYTYTTANNFFIQSSAMSGSSTQAQIVALINQSGSTANNIFEQALASLNGNITMGGTCHIVSDDTSTGNFGNIYANGKVIINGGYVGGTGCPAYGIASATGTITVNKWNGCVGESRPNLATPVSYTLTLSDFTGPADAGTNYTSQAASWAKGGNTYTVGPGWVNGNVSIGGDNIIILKGNLHVKGTLAIGAGAVVKGCYTIISDGNMTVSGNASSNLVAGNIPFIICNGAKLTISGSAEISAIIYAPNAAADLGKSTGPDGFTVYGSVIAKSITMGGSSVVKYLSGIALQTQIPGTGSGSTASLAQFDYR